MENSRHRSYSPQEIELLRQTPMAAILADLGYRTEHTRGNLYFSPFREERTPSFHVNDVDHKWCDFGDVDSRGGHPGGDTIALVERLLNCKLPEALAYLENLSASPSIEAFKSQVLSEASKTGSSKIIIKGVKDRISLDMLTSYGVYERHIPANILNRYCSQVSYCLEYQNGENSRNRYAIGFPNIDGKWSLRSQMKKAGKLSTGSNYSVITADGDSLSLNEEGILCRKSNGVPFTPDNHAKNVVVFEGFFDALSYLAWKGIETPGDSDIVILNSVTNTQRALGFILDHEKVATYLDNDDTGRKFTMLLASEVENLRREGVVIEHIDCSHAYKNYGDVNEAWCAKCRQAQQKALEAKTGTVRQSNNITTMNINTEGKYPYYTGDIKPGENIVFVFGSNPEGRHGAGAAKVAVEQFGAVYGQGEGLQGNAYALPTKDLRVKGNPDWKRSIPEKDIEQNITKLYEVARQNPEKSFCVAYRNVDHTSLNGYTGIEMMTMFINAGREAGGIPENIVFSEEWAKTAIKYIDEWRINAEREMAANREQKPQQQPQESKLPSNLSFSESSEGYSGRTYENAQAPDIDFTVAFATNFQTAGERCTARAAGSSLIRVDLFTDVDGETLFGAFDAAGKIYAALPDEYREGKPVGFNIAGNGLSTLKGITQEKLDNFLSITFKVLRNSGVDIRNLRSGGQTGVDQAAVAVAQTLGIPVHIHAPKDWKWRDAEGVDHTGEEAFKSRFVMSPSAQNTLRYINSTTKDGLDRARPVLFKTTDGKFNFLNVENRQVLLHRDVDRADFFRGENARVSINGVNLEINREGVVMRNLTHEENVKHGQGHSF